MSSSYFMLRILKRKRNRNNKLKQFVNEQKREEIVTQSSTYKCRICLKDGCGIPIFSNINRLNISDAIRTIGAVDLSEKDVYPKHLCDACLSLLKGALLFRKSAQDSDKLLRQSPLIDVSHEHDSDSIIIDTGNGYVGDLENHNNVHKSYKCKICKLNFSNWNEYLTHKNSKQHRNVRIQCPICNGLLTAQLYKKHLARHQSVSHLICDVCGKLYRKDNLVRHLQLHSFKLPFQCQMCPYRGRFMESLKIHMRTHTGLKPFSCDNCELHFLTRSNLNRHLLTHKKERPFKCVECGRGFYTKRDMEVHFKSDHAGIKDFVCRLCGNKYGTRKALMRHELRVHKRDKMAKGRMPLYLQAQYIKCNETTNVIRK